MPKETAVSSEDDWKNRIMYPSLCLNSKDLPGIQDLDVGDTVLFTFRAKVTMKSMRADGNGENAHLDFDMLKGGFEPVDAEKEKSNNKEADVTDMPTEKKDFMNDLMDDGEGDD